MAKKLNLKSARFLYEQNLDRYKRPTATGGASAYTVAKVLDSKGKVINKKTRAAKGE